MLYLTLGGWEHLEVFRDSDARGASLWWYHVAGECQWYRGTGVDRVKPVGPCWFVYVMRNSRTEGAHAILFGRDMNALRSNKQVNLSQARMHKALHTCIIRTASTWTLIQYLHFVSGDFPSRNFARCACQTVNGRYEIQNRTIPVQQLGTCYVSRGAEK